jgi:hypothetical protein
LYRVALRITDDVSINSKRYPRVAVPQLFLHHSGCYAVRKEGTSCSMAKKEVECPGRSSCVHSVLGGGANEIKEVQEGTDAS